jgi:hypothetical protein
MLNIGKSVGIKPKASQKLSSLDYIFILMKLVNPIDRRYNMFPGYSLLSDGYLQNGTYSLNSEQLHS